MDVVLYYDALATYCLQDYFYRLPFMEGLALAVTRLGDPRYSYVITFPLVYWLLGARAGYHVILAASVAEWCNIVLKWLLLGNRPYWWVWLHTDWPRLLHQTPATCETGPGNPSGHVMITLVVLLTCADYVGKGLMECERDGGHSKPSSAASSVAEWWARCVVWVVVVMIGISRLLISSHFIHQIVCGVMVGIVIHRLTARRLRALLNGGGGGVVCLSPLMITLALLLFHVWTWIGMDPGFSIPLAQRYCANSDWVTLNTTPLFSLMRSAGSVVGVAIINILRPHSLASGCSLNSSVIGIILSCILIGCLDVVPKATDITMFYAQSFCLSATVPVIVTGIDFILNRLYKK